MSRIHQLIEKREAVVGVIGLGYVGLPLAAASAKAGFRTIGFDTDQSKIPILNSGNSYIDAVPSTDLKSSIEEGRFEAIGDFGRLGECDIIVICVPTPLTKHHEPDLSYVMASCQSISRTLRKDQVISLESTTHPGTTTQIVRPIMEAQGMRSGEDFFLGFSPEREDPGNKSFNTTNIPKIVSGDGEEATSILALFYSSVVSEVVPVSTPDTAEAVKITENIFRSINIALVNELKLIFERMGVDIWEVIEAAKTKPFGFMPFYPGPGLGGHCIPIDPFYLTWRAKEFGVRTRFIELAGEINSAMPVHVVNRLDQALDWHCGKSLKGAQILILGVAYKGDVSDVRESPALRIISLLEERGAVCRYHDPLVPEIPLTREYPSLVGRESVALEDDSVGKVDAVLLITEHRNVDYELIARSAKLVVDTRNSFNRRDLKPKILVQA